MKKGVMKFAAVAAVLSTALAGYGGGAAEPAKTTGDAPKTTDAPKTEAPKAENFSITLRHINVRDTAKNTLALLEEVVAQTKKDVPGLDIKLDGVEDTVNRDVKLKAEMAAGKPPQIFNLFGGADTQNYVKAGHLLPLNDILKELGLEDKFMDLGSFTVDGKIYGLPEAGYVQGFTYNTKLFQDAGITAPPKTWEEFLKACEALKAKGITPIALGGGAGDGWAINMIANSLFVAHAGKEVQDGFAKGQSKWTDPAILEGFKKLKELKDKGYIDPNVLGLKYPEGQAKFYTGQAGMVFDGTWAANAILDKEKSKVHENVGFFAMPTVGGKGDGSINGGWSNGYGFSAHLNENEKKAVKAFIKNFYTADNQAKALSTDRRIPAMKGIQTPADSHPLMKAIGDAQAKATGAFPAYDDKVQPKVKITLEQSVQELLGGQITPEKLVEKMQKVQDEANAAK